MAATLKPAPRAVSEASVLWGDTWGNTFTPQNTEKGAFTLRFFFRQIIFSILAASIGISFSTFSRIAHFQAEILRQGHRTHVVQIRAVQMDHRIIVLRRPSVRVGVFIAVDGRAIGKDRGTKRSRFAQNTDFT